MLVFNLDDDADDRELFRYAVKVVDPKISCVLFENAQDLLDYMETKAVLPDFLFIDINMPKMNGYECVRKIKSDKDLKHIKIIMHSTAFIPKDVVEFEKMEVGFLIKHITLTDLIQDIKKLIEGTI